MITVSHKDLEFSTVSNNNLSSIWVVHLGRCYSRVPGTHQIQSREKGTVFLTNKEYDETGSYKQGKCPYSGVKVHLKRSYVRLLF